MDYKTSSRTPGQRHYRQARLLGRTEHFGMDNLAKIFWMTHSHTAPMFYPISNEGFQVWLGDRKLSSHSSDVFFDHIHGKTLLRWHATHHRFPACYARRIDWDVCEAALKCLPMGRRGCQTHLRSLCCRYDACSPQRATDPRLPTMW
jgi:hypothetical protein